ncbi:MAG TPA: orotate phosphoribosyltransferase [Candidatus Omnitrophica bacterium]|nr:MAG: orotate phosphoribosyltransferase [Candidatus Omnitrophota bacterium]HEC69044.1 orotate phosphoribosyltransferase [Candidatus Omnitrophota bacterium]
MRKAKVHRELFNLIKKEAFFKKKVLLSSGKVSNYYIDLRKITLQSKGAYLVANLLWEEIKREKFSFLGGPTLGADPILSAIAYHSYLKGKPLKTFIVRKERKKHGQAQVIEGPPLKKKSRVIIIDDVATTGASLGEAAKKLIPLGVKIVKAWVIVDREEGAKEFLSKLGISLNSLFRLSDFLK